MLSIRLLCMHLNVDQYLFNILRRSGGDGDSWGWGSGPQRKYYSRLPCLHGYTSQPKLKQIQSRPCGATEALLLLLLLLSIKVAHTRLPSVGFRSWSRFSAVSLQVMWVINTAVGCHYFPPGLQLPPQPLSGPLPILLLGEQRHNGCEQFA